MKQRLPSSAVMDLPQYMYGGKLDELAKSAGLDLTAEGTRWRVRTVEDAHKDAALVTHIPISVPGAPPDEITDAFDKVLSLERSSFQPVRDDQSDILDAVRVHAEALLRVGEPAASFDYLRLKLATAPNKEAGATARWALQELRGLSSTPPQTRPDFPQAGLHLIYRREALRARLRLASVYLREAQDPSLQSGDVAGAKAAVDAGHQAFASSSHLYEGSTALDAYVAPLMGALSPWIWGFTTCRTVGAYVFTLGTLVSGTRAVATEPLQLLTLGGPTSVPPKPTITPAATSSAVQWWARRLNTLFGYLTNPAVFTDALGTWDPALHIEGVLSVEQLFVRVAAIQAGYHDGKARPPHAFSVLDTLADCLMPSQTFEQMCSLEHATKTLDRLERDIQPAEARDVLLPAARRAVQALADTQNGFFLRDQLRTNDVELHIDGVVHKVDVSEAVAEYLHILRNATHGHGSKFAHKAARIRAYLAHHTGAIPHDLPLLAYLYLLDLMTRPQVLAQALRTGKT